LSLIRFSSRFHALTDIVAVVRVLPVLLGQYPYDTGSRGFLFSPIPSVASSWNMT
jgi:hypothetical protein